MSLGKRNSRSSKQLGDLGEAILLKWAREAGLVVNDSNDDRAGWDFFVELPPSEAHSAARTAPYHEEVYPLRAFVQVKATDSKPSSHPIKLSNWERHLERSEPAFFLVLEMEGKNDPEAAYLVHVGEELIRRVLRRLHENWVGERKPPNRTEMSFSYGPSDRLSSYNGQALKKELIAPIREIGTAAGYSQWKKNLVHTAGFEKGNYAIKIIPADESLGEDDPEVALSDLQVGLRETIPYSQAEFYPSRFGLRTEEPSHRLGAGNIEAQGREPLAQVQIDVSASGTPRRSSFEADFYASGALLKALKDGGNTEQFPMRFSTPFFEFEAKAGPSGGSWGKAPVRFSLPEKDEQVTLDEARRFAGMILILTRATEKDASTEVEVSWDGDTLLNFSIKPEEVSEMKLEDLVPVSHAFDNAWELAKEFDLLHAKVSIESLEKNLKTHEMIASVLRGKASGSEISFELSPYSGLDPGKVMSDIPSSGAPLIWLCETRLGSRILVAAILFVGELETTLNDNGSFHYCLSVERSRFLVKRVATDSESITESPEELVQIAAQELGRPYLAIIGGDLIE